eukprot:3285183-Rhodomonas_salina.1
MPGVEDEGFQKALDILGQKRSSSATLYEDTLKAAVKVAEGYISSNEGRAAKELTRSAGAATKEPTEERCALL